MVKFQNKYRIPSNRLQGYDYGSHGLYFVTICTKNRKYFFGNIVETHNNASNIQTHNHASEIGTNDNASNIAETHNYASLQPTPIGQIAIDYWSEIPLHYPFVELDEFVVMPNHLHGILFFNRPEKTDWTPNIFGPQSQNLGAVIRGFKSSVKRYANQNEIEFDWQSRFHDHIIRNKKSLFAIRNYIIQNPQNWYNDILNNPPVKTHDDASPVKTHNHASLQSDMETEIQIITNPEKND